MVPMNGVTQMQVIMQGVKGYVVCVLVKVGDLHRVSVPGVSV